MKRALRNTDTALFIKSDLAETGLIDEARSFDTYQAAFEFCANNGLRRVELVVRTSDRYEFIVEVPVPGATVTEPAPPQASPEPAAIETIES